MSVDTQATIIVGLPYADFSDADPVEQWLNEDMVLESFAPYYDAPREDCVIGIKYERTGSYDILNISLGELHELKLDFYEITGKWPEVILTLDVS